MIVAMAVITTMAMPPTLRWALARVPLGKAEKARLEREQFEETGFVANLERLLLAVDESANGKFAARVAGLIVGARGIPITILHVGPHSKRQNVNRGKEGSPETAVMEGAHTTAVVEEEAEDQKPPKVDITTRVAGRRSQDVVVEEARKGYDLMVTGIEKSAAARGVFHPDLARLTKGFEGPLAIVIARGPHLEQATKSEFRILVPITGTDVSRRAAEVAVALARANDVPITALYIAGTSDGKGRRRGVTPTRAHEEEILKDVVALAERYDAEVRTAVRVDAEPEEAILREVRGGQYNLIIMGANRRPGEALYFGNVAAATLDKAKASFIFVTG
jgi:nucleotide-binding universal stress UspA family protein